MKRVVIIGAGGHGREVADILQHQARQGEALHLLGFVDDRADLHGKIVNGVPVLGDWSWFERPEAGTVAVICAIGTPAVCRRVAERADAAGLTFASAISPLATISPSAALGAGVMIFPHTFVSAGVRLENHTIVNVGASISHDCHIGRYTNINPGARLAGNVTVGEGCYIGMGSSIIQGRTIGPWTIIGAGAAVVRDLPAHVTAVGVPARVRKQRKGVSS